MTYGRVQGRDALVAHFRASKFPSDDIEFMPLVFTRVEGGLATRPAPIHQYLGALDSGALAPAHIEAGGAEAAAEAGAGGAEHRAGDSVPAEEASGNGSGRA